VAVRDGRVRIEVPRGADSAAQLFAALGGAADAVTVGRPTLEDVFLQLTGESLHGEGEP
jgi:hypothetical protein